MKPTVLFSTLLLCSATASAQLTLLPQLGFENAKTSFQQNNSAFSSLPNQMAFKANVKLDYRFKKGHGVFAGVGTSPAATALQFNDVADAPQDYKLATKDLQWRVESGYQFTSKPIYFKKAPANTTNSNTRTEIQKYGCGTRTTSRCSSKKTTAAVPKNNNLNLRLQPYAGLAYVPTVAPTASTTNTGYQYLAGNWNTTVISGVGFEFGRGKERLFTLSAHYTKGVGNLGTRQFSSEANGKASTVALASKGANWGLTFGVPISLTKIKERNQKPATAPTQKATYRKDCSRYKTIRHI